MYEGEADRNDDNDRTPAASLNFDGYRGNVVNGDATHNDSTNDGPSLEWQLSQKHYTPNDYTQDN